MLSVIRALLYVAGCFLCIFTHCLSVGPVCFFSHPFQEMVGAAGPLRKGDEVEFLLPEGKAVEAGRRAVGAIRVQVRC